MVCIEISKEDKLWLKENYPDLKIVKADSPCLLKGKLCFDMFYDQNNKKYFLNPSEDYEPVKYKICDEYDVEISCAKTKFSNLPSVKEIGGRIERIKRLKGFTHFKELHVNDNTGNACLCPMQAELRILNDGFNFKDFLHWLVIPFFYSQTFYARHGVWIFGDYDHAEIGLLQYYLRVRDKLDKSLIKDTVKSLKIYSSWQLSCYEFLRDEIGWINPCLCGSKKDFQECHPDAYWGLWLLRQDINRLKMVSQA